MNLPYPNMIGIMTQHKAPTSLSLSDYTGAVLRTASNEGSVCNNEHEKLHLNFLSFALPAILASLSPVAAAGGACKRPELEWSGWRDNVLASNPGADFFELRGDGRDELLRAHGCLVTGEDCPPDQLMVFHCIGNRKVLIAFVKGGCVTRAKDMTFEDHHLYVTGGAPC